MFGNLGRGSSEMWLLAVRCQMTTQPGVEIVRWSWPVTGSLGSAGLLAEGRQVALDCEAVSKDQKRQGGWQCGGQVTRGKERLAGVSRSLRPRWLWEAV